MILKEIDLNSFNIEDLYDKSIKRFFCEVYEYGITNSNDCNKYYNKKEIRNLLKSGSNLYFSFAYREGYSLVCSNNKEYIIDDEEEQDEYSIGIDMGDLYIAEDDCINIGFLVSYYDDNKKVIIKSAVEGDVGIYNRCVEIDNCGYLEEEMRSYLDGFIL